MRLRDHLSAVHQNTVQPETRGVLLKPFVVIEPARRSVAAPADGGSEGGRARRPFDGGLTLDPEQAHQPP